MGRFPHPQTHVDRPPDGWGGTEGRIGPWGWVVKMGVLSDKYESAPATGSLYFVIFRIVVEIIQNDSASVSSTIGVLVLRTGV
jgi:hypothetical protein